MNLHHYPPGTTPTHNRQGKSQPGAAEHRVRLFIFPACQTRRLKGTELETLSRPSSSLPTLPLYETRRWLGEVRKGTEW
ncbi:hypothetical protein E2C01_046883 [Portunus trituberculatus]|uniref:Uncharacterized protein n=1 Tax=Portunus trituberculatus TaxID=210409 RepID=A0A5B7G600_PORTR|nr:hypothetical protein [Portunus trituberculatus]